MTITLTREEAQQALDALEHAQATEPIWKTPIREAKETLRARLAQPDPEQTRSEKMREAGYTKRDTRLECDECGKKFTRQMLPVHDCQPEPKSVRERVDETLIALAEAEGKNTLICPKCKADRFKVDCPGDRLNCGLIVKALPATEPVGYVYSEAWTPIKKAAIDGDIPNGTPLYTAPVEREWLGLTDAEVEELECADVLSVRAIEAKLKEKNG